MAFDYTYNGITVNVVRKLSDNEKKELNKSIDVAVKLYPDNEKKQAVFANSAYKTIVCNNVLWPQLAGSIMNAISTFTEEKNEKKLAYMQIVRDGAIIGMTHVFEVKYNAHNGNYIANFIDKWTRPADADALPGFFNNELALKVITKAYGTDANTETVAK